jgi:hypothetical protein
LRHSQTGKQRTCHGRMIAAIVGLLATDSQGGTPFRGTR